MTPEELDALRRNIRIALAARGETARWLGRKLGWNDAQISTYLHGGRKIEPHIQSIAKILKVPVTSLTDGNPCPNCKHTEDR